MVELAQGELVQQESSDFARAVLHGFQAHRSTITTMGQLTLQGAPQVLDFFIVDKQIAIAGHAELIAAAHSHAGKQQVHKGFDYRRQQHKATAELCRHRRNARQ